VTTAAPETSGAYTSNVATLSSRVHRVVRESGSAVPGEKREGFAEGERPAPGE